MTVQWSTTLRNAILDHWEDTIGQSAIFQVRSGAQPANCAAADSGSLLAQFDFTYDWAAAASGGVKSLNGLPLTTLALTDGTAAHYRLKDSTGATCHEQGTVTATGGGGDATINATGITTGQTVNLITYNKTAPGA